MKLKVFVIATLSICCACSNNEAEVKNQTVRELTREEKICLTEQQLQEATHAIPLCVPILAESGPQLHLIPVIPTEDSKTIEQIYVLDARDSTREVDLSRDLYVLDSLVKNDYSYRYAVVTDLSGNAHRLNIEDEMGFGFQLRELYHDPPMGLGCNRIPVVEESGAAQ